MNYKKLTTGLLCAAMIAMSPLKAQQRDMRFETKPAMYAANEEWLTFACELPDEMVNLDSKHQAEMYWYSRYGLGNLLLRSGMGVHMVNNPLFKKHAEEDQGMEWSSGMMLMRQRKFMMHKIAQFKIASGADKATNNMGGLEPPEGAFPIYLEYASGDPTFVKDPQLDDWSTLRWNDKDMDKTLNPGAWGQSMMKQVLWSQDFFTGYRTSNGITYLGNSADDGANGFRGSILTAMALAKSYALKSEMAYNAKTGELGGVDPVSYNPMEGAVYYPHAYEAKYKTMMMKPMMNMMVDGKIPPIVSKFVVTDPTSDLFDVASLLWAESQFYFFTDPTIKDDYDLVFGDPMWNPFGDQSEIEAALQSGKTIFPAGDPHMLAKGISVVNFKNMKGLHFAADKGTLVDVWDPEKGQGDHISTYYAGMAIMALANTANQLHDVEMVKNGAKMIMTAQADFLLQHQDSDGGIANGFSTNGTADAGARTLLAQTFAIRGWLEAYKVTGADKYLKAAQKAKAYMDSKLWSESAGLYRSEEGAAKSEYDPMNYGSTLGALRELAITQTGNERRETVATLDTFFENVRNVNGLQIAEITPTGEPIPSAEQAEKMMAQIKEMPTDKAMSMKKKMMDADSDGVPKPKFVPNTKHGAAPVSAGRVFVETN